MHIIYQIIMEAICMDINSKAEQYKQEMMRLYGLRSDVPPGITEDTDDALPNVPQTIPDDEEIFGVDEDAPDDTAYSDHIDENADDDLNNRYPEPDLSELDTDLGQIISEDDSPPQYADEESMGSAIGYILVNVRTGDEASAVEGATVMVTAIVNGSRLIIASGQTDQSGTAPKFSVPVPDISHSQLPDPSVRPYSLFDVSVTADGFFNARSVDVPAFEGITSVQNFSMIPVPAMMNSSDETVTYFNQEPPLSEPLN